MQEEIGNKPEEIQENSAIELTETPGAPSVTAKHPFFVFTINTVLGLVLLAGLVILYILVLTKKDNQVQLPPALQNSKGKALSVVYLNLDSLNLKYEFIRNLRKDLESTVNRLQGELKKDEESLQKDGADFQQKVQANAISEEKSKQIYEILMKRQQELLEKKDRYTQMMTQQQLAMNQVLTDTLTTFLKRFNRTYRFDYIMGYKSDGEILVANDTLDITHTILEAINKEYLERKK
ncbi:MAG: OmpH family outer membrane protein [Bacteroidetes bacterium]|nr:OmpH family outer membrane protein [Bacteroidota bacterium]